MSSKSGIVEGKVVDWVLIEAMRNPLGAWDEMHVMHPHSQQESDLTFPVLVVPIPARRTAAECRSLIENAIYGQSPEESRATNGA